MLVNSYPDLHALRLMFYRAAVRDDCGEGVRHEDYMVKVVGDRMSFEATDRCMQIHGGLGVTIDLPVEMYWRAQRSMMITEGPEEILRPLSPREILGDYA